MTGLGQSVVSSQMTSSHITVPLSHTQIWHGSGFHTSRSANTWPSKVQLPPVSEGGDTERGGTQVRQGLSDEIDEVKKQVTLKANAAVYADNFTSQL